MKGQPPLWSGDGQVGRLEAVLMSCSNWDASLILCSQQSRFDVVLDLEKNHRQGDALIRFGESR